MILARPNKVSIKMVKLCEKSIVKPLCIIFKNCKLKKTFPDLWKKVNVQFSKRRKRSAGYKKLSSSFTLKKFWKNAKNKYLTLFLNTLMKMNRLILVYQAFVHSPLM